MANNLLYLDRFITALDRWGLTDVLLPFLLVFTLIFAVLEKTKILGEGKKNFNIIISLVMALMVVVPHVTGRYPAGYDPVQIINAALPSVSLLVVAVIMLLIMIGLFAHDKIYLGLTMPGWIAIVSIILILTIFGSAAGWYASGFNSWLTGVFGNDALAVVIMLLVFGVIIAFITGGGEDKEQFNAFKKIGINFGELFGGNK